MFRESNNSRLNARYWNVKYNNKSQKERKENEDKQFMKVK